MALSFKYIVKTAYKAKAVTTQIRFYPRWSHRRPVNVYTPEEYEGIEGKKDRKSNPVKIFDKYGSPRPTWDQAGSEQETIKYKITKKKVPLPLIASNQKSVVKDTVDMLETVIDKDGNFVYTKMSNNDRRVGAIMTQIKSKKEKDKKDLILLEGKQLIKDALTSNCHLKYMLFSRQQDVEDLKPYLPKIGSQLYKMPYKEIQMWSDLTTSPGVIGVFKTPDVENFKPKDPLPITVICDNIREPGNLGVILRICAAVSCEGVILTKGCVNLWDTKVLRSSVGAHFKLKISKNMEWDTIANCIGEANVFIADNKITSSVENSSDLVDILNQVPLLLYHAVDFSIPKHVVLIIGGETFGISKDSYKLALKSNGARLHIPLNNDIDSLNVGSALGIIAFEIRKQLCKV